MICDLQVAKRRGLHISPVYLNPADSADSSSRWRAVFLLPQASSCPSQRPRVSPCSFSLSTLPPSVLPLFTYIYMLIISGLLCPPPNSVSLDVSQLSLTAFCSISKKQPLDLPPSVCPTCFSDIFILQVSQAKNLEDILNSFFLYDPPLVH